MLLRSRVGGVLMGLSLVGVLGAIPSLAQDQAREKAGASASVSYRRVPTYFSKIGLTPEQKEKIYAIRGKHQTQVDELKRQLEEVQAQEMVACESVLNDAQKQQLEQFRNAPRAKSKTTTRSSKAAN